MISCLVSCSEITHPSSGLYLSPRTLNITLVRHIIWLLSYQQIKGPIILLFIINEFHILLICSN